MTNLGIIAYICMALFVASLICIVVLFAKKIAKKIIIAICIVTVLCFVAMIYLFCYDYYLQKKNFHSFDLSELKRHELIIQTIEFKKFLMNGTDGSGSSRLDELQVYHVSGRADISFTDIENLFYDEESSDMGQKIMRLNYDNPQKGVPFSVNVIINENDIQQVARFESEPVNMLGFKKDLIKPGMSQAEIVDICRNELQEEFYRQIVDVSGVDTLSEFDIYQTFIERLTQIITSVSDWESVEVKFVNE